MGKYWKTIALIIGIMLSIGTFYMNSASSAENYPEFAIQTLSGNPEEVESLVLDGSYTISSYANYISTNLKITAEGSSYSRRSFIDQVRGYSPAVIEEWQEEYRSFMRGKNSHVNQFFEDNEFLAYVNADSSISSLGRNDFNFEISVLSKGDGEVNSFTLEVPEKGELDYVSVEDVQLADNKLYIITQNMVRENDEKHVYEIDLASQEIISHEALLKFTQWKEDVHTHIQLVESSPTAANEHIILLKTEETMMEAAESDRVANTNREVVSYNLETKEKETINVPGLSLAENQLSFVDGSTIYFTRMEEQEMIITPYRLGEDQADQEFKIPLQAAIEGEYFQLEATQFPMISIKEGKIYAVSQQFDSNSNGNVAVIDMKTGEALFKGQIVLKNSSEEQQDFELYMNEIFVK